MSRARVLIALGTARACCNDHAGAARAWQRARHLALETGNSFLATAAVELLAGTLIYHQGRLRAGASALQEVLDLGATPDGQAWPFTGTCHALLGEVYLEWDDLESASHYLEVGVELLRRGGIGYALIHTHCARAGLPAYLHEVRQIIRFILLFIQKPWLGEGRSNHEIAEALVITLETIKKHLGNIYGELGLHSQIRAVVLRYAPRSWPSCKGIYPHRFPYTFG